MLIFLLEECSLKCVGEAFDSLTEFFGVEEFRKSFPIILSDNGSEATTHLNCISYFGIIGWSGFKSHPAG